MKHFGRPFGTSICLVWHWLCQCLLAVMANQDTLLHIPPMRLLQVHGERFTGHGSLAKPVAHAQRLLKSASQRYPKRQKKQAPPPSQTTLGYSRSQDDMRRQCGYGLLYELSKKNPKGMDDAYLLDRIAHLLHAIGPVSFGDDNNCEPSDVLKHLTSDYLKRKLAG